jgi:predicted nucleic acid-binding protein
VLDSSAALGWCFGDEQSQAGRALLDRVSADGAVVPPLWSLEVLNALLIGERRRRIDAAMREELGRFLRGLPLAVDGEMEAHAWDATAALAARHGLTAYDAAYLELAARRRLPLASRNAALTAAARAAGVMLLAA